MDTSPNWVELQGSVNARDVGGLPTGDGRAVRPGVLIRSANLQHLTEADVRHLVGDRGVRRVVDLRTDVEVDGTGPGPLHDVPDVTIHHLSLYPDLLDRAESVSDVVNPGGGEAEVRGSGGEAEVRMPWHGEFATSRGPVVSAYLRYLERRPDSLVAALKAIAEPDGATVVHCAAGKDRTGVVVALALAVVGVPREVIAADYAVTESQIAAIVSHLARSDMYNREVSQPEKIPPASADIMISVLDAVDEEHGSVESWLAGHGWTDAHTARLKARLLG